MEKLPERCVVCGNDTGSVLMRHNPWRVLACTRCGLGVLDPCPTEDDLQKPYDADYFLSQYDGGLDPSSAEFQKRIQSEDHRVRFIQIPILRWVARPIAKLYSGTSIAVIARRKTPLV